MSKNKTVYVVALHAVWLASGFCAQAQFLRLGPFDFEAQTRIEAVYTTNVEEERPSEATAEREDYFLVWGLDLRSDKQISYRTRLFLDTGIAIEKHFVRDDLDNSENPFGRVDARYISDWDPITFYGGVLWERESESVDEKFVPNSLPQKGRQVGTTTDYLIGSDIVFKYLTLGASFEYEEERYDEKKFADAENNESTIIYYFEVKPHRYISLRYEMESKKTDFINTREPEGDWIDDEELTLKIDINELFGLWDRPKVTYSIGIQREDEQLDNPNAGTEEEGWEFIHRLSITDDFMLSPALSWKYFILYDYEDKPEEDDITLEYGISINQELTKRVNHRFTASRRPVETLGSTDDTDETKYDYTMNIQDFMLPNITGFAGIIYSIDDPITGPTEKIWDTQYGVQHSVLINRSLTREIKYEYSREDSNLEREILDEHRVTLTYRYDF